MIIDLRGLMNGNIEYVDVDLNYSFSKEELMGTSILEFNDCKIKGTIKESYDDLSLDLTVEGTMVLPCSVSLKPVNYPINIKIEGNSSELIEDFDANVENTIDIFSIIWENILMEIPLRVVSDDLSDVKTSGDGWRIITDKKEEVKS